MSKFAIPKGFVGVYPLAFLEGKSLFELERITGFTVLRVYPGDNDLSGSFTNQSYQSLPLKLLREVVYGGKEWRGNPHGRHPCDGKLKSAAEILGERTKGVEPAYFVEMTKTYTDKDYCHEDIVITGVMPIKATNPVSAIRSVKDMQKSENPLQTIDPRISWDKRIPNGFTYEDFTFGTTGRNVPADQAVQFRCKH